MKEDNKLLHELFAKRVQEYPEHIAIDSITGRVTYRELYESSNTIIKTFHNLGIAGESIIGMILPSGADLIAGLMASLSSGMIYMPLDMAFSERRFQQIFSQTFSGILITNEALQNEVKELLKKLEVELQYLIVMRKDKVPAIYQSIEGELTSLEVKEQSNDRPEAMEPGDKAYIFYTSGSTGEGKAILGSYRSLTQYINWHIRTFGFGEKLRVAQVAQITFDASLKDILPALCSGSTLCIPAAETRASNVGLAKWLKNTEVEVLQCVPSIFRLITKALAEDKDLVPPLKQILLAGEPLYAQDLLNWQTAAGSGAEITNLYGTTESTILKTYHRIQEIPENAGQIIHVGKAMDEAAVAVINEGRICRLGEIGEVYIKSPFLTKGYLNNDEMNSAVFVQNPLVSDREDIIYKTGDLGRFTTDSNLEILGRVDHQVKINGVRVELGEVEQAVLRHPSVTGAVVNVYKKDKTENHLVCYYIADNLEVDELRGFLKTQLNANLLPSFFIHMQEFPLNINGKIDRKALPKPELHLIDQDTFEEVTGETEKALHQIWVELLGHEKISRNTSFFSVGGSSLKAIVLVSRIFKSFGVTLKMANVFNYNTISQLATYIEEAQKEEQKNIPILPIQEYYTVSHAQQRLWTLRQTDSNAASYNVFKAYLLIGLVNLEALDRSLKRLVDRHEILRTSFHFVEGKLMQKIHAFGETGFKVEYHDLRDYDAPEDMARKMVNEDRMKGFDLEQPNPIRAGIYQISDEKYVFLLNMHHIVCDGWSMEIIVDEVLKTYKAYDAEKEALNHPLRIQYKDFAHWHTHLIQNKEMEEYRNFWSRHLAGWKPLDLSTDGKREESGSSQGKSLKKVIDEELSAKIRRLCDSENMSYYTVLSAAIKALLHRYTNSSSITLGSPVAGRNHPDLEKQVGLYLNTLPFHSLLSPDHTMKQLLHQVKDEVEQALKHEEYPLDLIVDHCWEKEKNNDSALFEVGFTWHNHVFADEDIELDFDIDQWQKHVINAGTALWFHGEQNSDGQLQLSVDYEEGVWKEDSIGNILDRVVLVLEAMVNDKEQTIEDIPLGGRTKQSQANKLLIDLDI